MFINEYTQCRLDYEKLNLQKLTMTVAQAARPGTDAREEDMESTSDPYLIIMSDTHVSSPEGRWPQTTARFRSFLETVQADPPARLFINGDMLDNMTLEDGKPVIGDLHNWTKDRDTYKDLAADFPGIDILGSLGPGHDFGDGVSMAHAAEGLSRARGVPLRIGTFYDQGHYFRVSVRDGDLNIEPHTCPMAGG